MPRCGHIGHVVQNALFLLKLSEVDSGIGQAKQGLRDFYQRF